MPYITLKQARKIVAARPANRDVLDTLDLAVRWGMEPETLAGWRQRSRFVKKTGIPKNGPKFFRLGNSPRGPVRYRLKEVEEYENRPC